MSSHAVRKALEEPSVPANPGDPQKIIAGVLTKWVNLGRGWRHRLFVLKDGVLRYYRVVGLTPRANIYEMFQALRAEGELQLIGAEAAILDEKWRRKGNGHALHDAASVLADPQAEVHLQVATIEASEGDHCKLYVHTNVNNITYRMKAETTNTNVTASVLKTLATRTQAQWDGRPPDVATALTSPSTSARQRQDDRMRALLAEVQAELSRRGATPDVQSYVAEVLQAQYQRYQEYMTSEADMRRTLQRHIRDLESQRRQLETAVVVESQTARKDKGTELESTTGSARSEDSSNDADGDGDRFYSDDGEAFFDARSRSGSSTMDMESLRSQLSDTSDGSADGRSPQQPFGGSGGGEPDWIKEEGPPPHRRERLPKPHQAEKSVSLWSILKEVVGKDLTRVCLPVYFNEPLSALQKMAEELEYSELVDKALTYPKGSTERMLFISAFAVSGYSGTAGRTTKPFNPLLGETYEFVCPEKGVRMLAEKVVHHPTIIAGHAEGRRWTLDADGDVRSKFWGRSIELTPVGTIRLRTDDGEEYQWHKVTTTIGNLILGKIYVDHGGIMRVRNNTTGLTARIKFKEQGLLRDRESHVVHGTFEQGKQKFDKPVINGKWDDSLTADMPDGSQLLLWKRSPPPPDPTRYNFTSWAIKLNEITPGLKEKLAPTDCRLRPDQHATEFGDYDEANQQKLRLEQKQRAARKAAESGEPIQPRWFTPKDTPMGEALAFEYKGGYFESRRKGDWSGCRDIFGH